MIKSFKRIININFDLSQACQKCITMFRNVRLLRGKMNKIILSLITARLIFLLNKLFNLLSFIKVE